MKKFFYLLLAFVATVTFAGCSDDDAPKTPDASDVIEKDIVGNYGGNLTINVDGTEFPPVPQGISIKKGSRENTISLSIANFSFMGIKLGDINLNDCPLTGKDGNYAFTNDEALNLTADGGFSAIVNLKNAKIVKEEVSFDLDIDATVGDIKQKVKVSYKGKRGQAVEEEKSNEAKVLSFKFDENYEEHPMHKVLVDFNATIDNEAKTITFKVNKELLAEETYAEALKGLYPTIEVSENATYSPAEGFDFSNDEAPVKVLVTAEDGETTAEYTVVVVKYLVPTTLKNSFEEWGDMASVATEGKQQWRAPQPFNIWASANDGVAMIKQFGGNTEYAMLPAIDESGKEEAAVKLTTLYTKGMALTMAPSITPATFFTGEFVFDFVVQPEKQLKLTHFGIKFKGKPSTLKVKYKYTPGTQWNDGPKDKDLEEIPNKDKGMIIAVLFDPSSVEAGWLDGTNLKNKDLHVMSAYVEGEEGISNTNGEWKTAEVPFTNGENYDPSKEYKIALVCQSSVNGDKFQGAVGSELIVDDIEVIAE